MRYFRALTLSVLFHGLAALVFWLLIPAAPPLPLHQVPIAVELLESPELPRRPKRLPIDDKFFVRSSQAPKEALTDKQNKKRFASESEQNVLEETQARASGLTANRTQDVNVERSKQAARDPSKQEKPSRKIAFTPGSPLKRIAEETSNRENGDIEVGGLSPSKTRDSKAQANESRPLDFSRFGSIERGVSTVGEQLPSDIKFGDFTALNTDRHLYYSFYSRIEEMIRPRWVNYAKAVVYGIETGTELVQGRATWTTKIEVLLDPQGNFLRAILHQGSGVRNLDAAPVQAFRDSQKFPNPPAEMVKDDGAIHIYYAFSINMVPRYAGGGGDSGDTE